MKDFCGSNIVSNEHEENEGTKRHEERGSSGQKEKPADAGAQKKRLKKL